MTGTVLDASAVLAAAFREPGHEVVLAHLAGGLMSSVNAAEAMSKLSRLDRLALRPSELLHAYGLRIEPFGEADAEVCAALHVETRSSGLSLGDCACLALGRQRGAIVLTADRLWAGLGLDIDIRVIR